MNTPTTTIRDLESDIRMFGGDATYVLRQLAGMNKEFLRDAVHEAGHCVAAWHSGVTVHKMDIRAPDDFINGFKSVIFEMPQTKLKHWPDRTNFSIAVICLAGMAAEAMLFSESYKRSSWKPDINEAKAYLKKTSRDEKPSVLFQWAMDAANRIVHESWNRIACLTVGAYQFGPVLEGELILHLITNETMFDQSPSPIPALAL